MSHTLACDLWVMEPMALRRLVHRASLVVRQEQRDELVKATQQAQEPVKQKRIGIIRIHGSLEARPTALGQWLGMANYETIGRQFDTLLADPDISTIVLDVMSPGGMVYGAQELANKIYSARGQKRTVAIANPMAASGGYWLAAAAERVIATPSADVGSVGVIWEHADVSKMYEARGVKYTTIRSTNSPYKAEGSDVEPLSDDAKSHMQQRADEIYDRFVGDLARFRGTSVEHINQHYGQGRVVDSKRALAAGMIDRIDTFEGVIEKLFNNRIRFGGSSAEDDWNVPTVAEIRRQRIEHIKASIETGA